MNCTVVQYNKTLIDLISGVALENSWYLGDNKNAITLIPISVYYYNSVSFFLYKNMTVVLLLHPKIHCMTIPPVVPVNRFRTFPSCGNYSNHISRTFLNHSPHWFKLNDVIEVFKYFSLWEINYRDGRQQLNNGRGKQVCFARSQWYFENY